MYFKVVWSDPLELGLGMELFSTPINSIKETSWIFFIRINALSVLDKTLRMFRVEKFEGL